MSAQLLSCKLIDFPKLVAANASFSEEVATNLAASIKLHGLLHPITVRPHPEKPGRYLGISGRHRLHATQNILKEQAIEAIVFDDVDEDDAEQMTISENLWRLPLNKAQTLRATKRWWDYYSAKNPDLVAHRGAAGGAATKRKFEESKAGTPVVSAEAMESVGQEENRLEGPIERDTLDSAPIGFVRQLAASTGQSTRSAKRATRLARIFSEDDFTVFEQLDVTQQDMERIARIKEKGRRDEIIELIVQGLLPAEAIAATMNDPSEVMGEMFKGDTKRAAKKESDDHLSDAEWFDHHCRGLASRLADTTAYKAGAILYRRIIPYLLEHREAIRPILVEAIERGPSPLLDLIKRSCWIKHPKDWSVCRDCRGAGKVSPPDGVQPVPCKWCRTTGYRLELDEFP